MRNTSLAGAPRPIDWFERIVEGAPYAMVLADGSGTIRLLNANAERLFGYARAELLGKPLELLMPEDFPARHPDHLAATHADPQAPAMGAGRERYGLRKDGMEVPIEIGLNPIDTPDGAFTLVSISDITDRKRAEESQQQMAALVASADDAIIAKSLDGVIRSWNPGAERLLGYTAEEMTGQPVTRLLPDDRLEEEALILQRIRSGQRVAHFETVRARKDGSLVDVSLTISPIRNRYGAIVGASKVMRDITERKRHEQELEEFVYTASHDLRSPLTGVSTVAQWILEDDQSLSPETRERLLLIQGRVARMHRLLNDIRDYARAGRAIESPDENPGASAGNAVSVAALVDDIAATLHVPTGFSIRSDPSLQDILLNRVPFELVLRNLIGNAIKHHDRSAGSVTVAATARGEWHRFSVVDDGPGIADQYHAVIFEMFRTLRPRDVVEGSGMGLALVRKIVTKHGGACGIEPSQGRGAHFWFDWPRS